MYISLVWHFLQVHPVCYVFVVGIFIVCELFENVSVLCCMQNRTSKFFFYFYYFILKRTIYLCMYMHRDVQCIHKGWTIFFCVHSTKETQTQRRICNNIINALFILEIVKLDKKIYFLVRL